LKWLEFMAHWVTQARSTFPELAPQPQLGSMVPRAKFGSLADTVSTPQTKKVRPPTKITFEFHFRMNNRNAIAPDDPILRVAFLRISKRFVGVPIK
jgi:hypothetical protein